MRSLRSPARSARKDLGEQFGVFGDVLADR